MTILTSDGCTSVSHKVLQMFSPLFSDMGTGVGPSREEDVMIVNLPDFRSATVDLFMELLLSGQIEDGNEDTKEDVVHLAKILGIEFKLERSTNSDSSLVDRISEDTSYSGELRVRNFEEMASPTFKEQILPGPSSMISNIGGENFDDPEVIPLSPLFRNVTTTEDNVYVQVINQSSKCKEQTKKPSKEKISSRWCCVCPAVCSSEVNLKRHMRKCHIRCGICDKWIKTKEMLPNHSCNFCELCQEKFNSEGNLDRHMSEVHFSCGYCKKWIKTKRALFHHINFTHTNNKEPFHCHLCQGKFMFEDRLNCHLRSEHHKSIRPESRRFEIKEDNKVANFLYDVMNFYSL